MFDMWKVPTSAKSCGSNLQKGPMMTIAMLLLKLPSVGLSAFQHLFALNCSLFLKPPCSSNFLLTNRKWWVQCYIIWGATSKANPQSPPAPKGQIWEKSSLNLSPALQRRPCAWGNGVPKWRRWQWSIRVQRIKSVRSANNHKNIKTTHNQF